MLKNQIQCTAYKKDERCLKSPVRSVTLSFCLSNRQYGYNYTYFCLKSRIHKYFPRCTWLRIIYFTEVITKPRVSAIVIKYKIWLRRFSFALATDINNMIIYNRLSSKGNLHEGRCNEFSLLSHTPPLQLQTSGWRSLFLIYDLLKTNKNNGSHAGVPTSRNMHATKLCLSRQITKCFLDYIRFTFLGTLDEAHMYSLDGERKDSGFFIL